jgi:hypothetical protein
MSSAGTVTVKITAEEADLRAQLALARADLATFTGQVKTLSGEMVATGKVADASLNTALRSATTQAAQTGRAVGDLETQLKKIGPAAESGHGSVATATREFRALFDELSSGRTRMTPGTLAIIATRVFGLGGAALGAVAGVIAVTAALGYMAVKSIEAENALNRLKLSVDFKGIDVAKDQLKALASEIGADGDIIVAGMAKIADSGDELKALSLATEQYAQVSGEKAPEAVKLITDAMTSEHLTLAQLQSIFPNVTQAARDNFLAIQQAGNAHQTTAALVGLVSTQVGKLNADLITNHSGWTSTSNDIRLAAAEFQDLTGNLIPVSSAIEGGIKLWDQLSGALGRVRVATASYFGWLDKFTAFGQVQATLVGEATNKINAQTAAMERAATTTAAAAEANQHVISEGMKAGEAFDTEAKRADELGGAIKRMQKALATPGVSSGDAAKLTRDIADAQRQVADAAKRTKTEEYQNFVAKEDAMADATKAGSAKRIAAITAEVDKAKTLFGSESTEYYDAEKKLDAARNSGATAGVTAARQEGRSEIDAVKEKISEINADETQGGAERIALIQAQYTQLLANGKLTAAQRVAIETEQNNSLTAAHREAAAQQRQIDQNTTSADLAIAKIGFQDKRDLLAQEVAESKITKTQELQDLIAVAQAEGQAQQAALTKAQAGYAADAAFFIEKENEKRVAAAQTQQEIDKLNAQIVVSNRQAALQDAQGWSMAVGEITGAERTMIGGLLSGRESFYQAAAAASSELVQKEIEDDLSYYTKKLLLSDADFAADQAHEQGGIMAHLLGESAKTGATVAGTTARTTATVTGAAVSSAATTAADSSSIVNAAYVSAAEAYKSVMQSVPAPFNLVLAPVAAAGVFSAVLSYDTLTSLDVGSFNIPRDMPAMVHRGEMIIPKTFAEGYRANGGFGGSRNTTNHTTLNYGPTINAPEQQSLEDMLGNDSSTMRSWMTAQARNGWNPFR